MALETPSPSRRSLKAAPQDEGYVRGCSVITGLVPVISIRSALHF
jgi:hypothetical protein